MAKKQGTGGKKENGGAPSPSRRRRRPLKSAANIFTEMGAVYRDSRDGVINPEVGTELVYMLSELRKTFEVSEFVVALEQRISTLEARLAPKKSRETPAPA